MVDGRRAEERINDTFRQQFEKVLSWKKCLRRDQDRPDCISPNIAAGRKLSVMPNKAIIRLMIDGLRKVIPFTRAPTVPDNMVG